MVKATEPGPERLIPGAVVLAANKDGLIYSKAFGTQSVDPDSPLFKKPLAADTTMWIASCTKLMTAISVMQCVEKGLVTLDEDVSTILTEWKEPEILKGFEEDGKPILEKAKNKMTLRMLMNHSSGMGYEFLDPNLQQWVKYKGNKPSGTMRDYFLPLLFEPGTAWSYSVGLDWAGQVVERVNNGQRLGDYMQEHIWGPLGMKSTSFRLQQRQDIKDRRCDMTARLPDGSLVNSPDRVWPEHSEDDFGGGGAYSCPADYIKVLTALLKNDGTLFQKPATIDELFKPCLSPDSLMAFKQILYARYPGNENGEINLALSGGLPQSAGVNYAPGGLVVTAYAAGDGGKKARKAGSMAWGGLPNLFWAVDRETGVALLYASQVVPPGDRTSTEIWKRFEEAVYSGEVGSAKL